ncbi:MAG: hypothetical protein J2P17_12835, partial [Mycobacterium sp.]|nr:hypothetical protein [Mycobacterium sp.]
IAQPQSYRHYRLDIVDNHGSPHLQLETVRFLTCGDGGFAGYRQPANGVPVPYLGIRVAQPTVEQQPSRGGQVPLSPHMPQGYTPMRAQKTRSIGRVMWRPGQSWLPLGGSLSMQSVSSPSGRFTLLHSPYEPSLAVRDNLTRDRVWTIGSPSSSLCLGPDGALVAWDHHGNRIWSTGTAWLGVRRLELRDSGELVLTSRDGEVVWSTGIPDVPAGPPPRPVPIGSTLRRGERLDGQSLTSPDGSTILFHDGRVARIIVRGRTSHWDRFPDTENFLVLDDDGFLRMRDLDGGVLEEIAGPGTELVVERGVVELRDAAGAVVWASVPASQRPPPVREPRLAHNDDLLAWFTALTGRGHCVAVAKNCAPEQVLGRIGVTPVRGTWRQLQQHRDATLPDGGTVVAAIALGPDVLLVADNPELRVDELAPFTAAVRQPDEHFGFPVFDVYRGGKLVTELRTYPHHRRKGTTVPEVAAALEEIVHPMHSHALLFRTTEVIPTATALGGEMIGGVLAPAPELESTTSAEPPLVVDGWEDMTPLVVRTDFTDDDAWYQVIQEMSSPWMGNEPVPPCAVEDRRLSGAPTEQVLREVCAVLSEPNRPGALFIADAITMSEPAHPLLAVTTEWDGNPFEEDEEEFTTQFRLMPDAAIEISTNLDLGNMDFEDFVTDGIAERMA